MNHANLIPNPLRDKLIEAAMMTDDAERRRTVEKVTIAIKTTHPELFKSETDRFPVRNG